VLRVEQDVEEAIPDADGKHGTQRQRHWLGALHVHEDVGRTHVDGWFAGSMNPQIPKDCAEEVDARVCESPDPLNNFGKPVADNPHRE
jgi:hypothetical protein